MGFVWQFITLAGFHCDSLSIDLFAKDYSERGMLAYVEGIQRMERKHKVRTYRKSASTACLPWRRTPALCRFPLRLFLCADSPSFRCAAFVRLLCPCESYV